MGSSVPATFATSDGSSRPDLGPTLTFMFESTGSGGGVRLDPMAAVLPPLGEGRTVWVTDRGFVWPETGSG